MWWLCRITTVPVPQRAARFVASSIARSTSHGPGSRRPSHVTAAGASASTSGSPSRVMEPDSSSAR